MQVLDQKVTNARNASHNPKHVSNGLKKIQVIHPKMTIINQKKKNYVIHQKLQVINQKKFV